MDRYCQNSNIKKDHRQLGQELELFSFHKEGPGLPFFLPKGVALKNSLISLWRKLHEQEDYREIQSPMLLDRKLWEQSGHWHLYQEHMYISEVEKRVFAIKPMNCPGAILHYKEKKRSFKELPFRVCEMGQVHRDENSGSLHGLLRVRSFVVDDAHLFCKKEDLYPEVVAILKMAENILKFCGFKKLHFELSVCGKNRVEKYLGEDEEWNHAEHMLSDALKNSGFPFVRKEGEAKFYGPAIDVKIEDSLGKQWQCSSIQMDFNLAQRFKLKYFDQNGHAQIPYILHRCIYGSLERFIGILIEHYQGKFPMWLAPEQVRLISISENGKQHLQALKGDLVELGLRVRLDDKDANISQKIKQAHREKIPWVVLAGDKEALEGRFSLNGRDKLRYPMIKKGDLMEYLR